MQHVDEPPEKELMGIIYEKRRWFIALGAMLLLLGVAALVFPFAFTIAMKILLGWVFLLSGFTRIVHAFQTQGWGNFLLNILVGILYALAGAWLAFLPIAGIVSLTIVVGVVFIFSGLLEVAMGVQMRPEAGWGWLIGTGLVAMILGAGILLGLPGTATWVIGVLVGVNLISSGATYLAIGVNAGALRSGS